MFRSILTIIRECNEVHGKVTLTNFSNFTMHFITLPDDGQYGPKHVGVNNFIRVL